MNSCDSIRRSVRQTAESLQKENAPESHGKEQRKPEAAESVLSLCQSAGLDFNVISQLASV